jgi:hypothetical protein
MKTSMLALAALATAGVALEHEDLASREEQSSKDVTLEASRRFLFFAVFEGLWEDGADPALIKGILGKRSEHFVENCPNCTPVAHAFSVYANSTDIDNLPSRGTGLPKDLQDDLKSPNRPTRLKALEKLVDRYVSRRFEQSRMSDDETKKMRNRLQMGKKYAMGLLPESFGDHCPSCSGATKGGW